MEQVGEFAEIVRSGGFDQGQSQRQGLEREHHDLGAVHRIGAEIGETVLGADLPIAELRQDLTGVPDQHVEDGVAIHVYCLWS